VRDGTTLPSADVTRSAAVGFRTVADVIQPNRVLELHARGATMVLQGLQLTDPHLGRMANNLALALDHPVQVNAYLTPDGTTGLDVHFDYHDVFVVQLAGSKRWRVWEPLERTRDPVRARRVPQPTFDELGDPSLDLVLCRGDSLYLPRGFPHAASAVEQASAHLTIGVMKVAAPRSALSSRSWPDDRPDLDQGVQGARRLANEIWRRQPATRLRPLRPESIDDHTELAWTPGPLLWLCRDGERARLGLGDRELDLPGETYGFLHGVLASGAATVDAFADRLDLDSRRVVLRRLVAEGALAPAGASADG